MKNYLAATLLLLTMIAAGGVFLQQSDERRLAAELKETIATVATGYQKLVHDLVLPLDAAGYLNDDQKQIAQSLRDISDTITQASSVQETTALVSKVQKGLTAIANAKPTNPDTRFTQLQEEMSENGSIVHILQSYNDIAVQWNARTHSLLGSMMGSVTNRTSDLLPYLKFDGSQEYVPVIQL